MPDRPKNPAMQAAARKRWDGTAMPPELRAQHARDYARKRYHDRKHELTGPIYELLNGKGENEQGRKGTVTALWRCPRCKYAMEIDNVAKVTFSSVLTLHLRCTNQHCAEGGKEDVPT